MRYLLIATALALASDSSASWGASCSSSYGPVRVVRVVKKPAKKKAAKKNSAPKKAPKNKGGCPDTCRCDCVDYDDCPCLNGRAHCGCEACTCGMDSEKAKAIQSKPRVPKELNFGIDQDKFHSGPRYKINGVPVTREQMHEKLSKGKMVDDSGKLHYHMIDASAEKRKQFLEDAKTHPAFAPLKDTMHIQAFDPGYWSVSNEKYGFVPGVYLQANGLPPLIRLDNYPGPEKMAQLINEAVGGLRKKDPKYDPKKDPDGSKPLTAGFDPMLLWGGALVLLGALALKK